MFSFLNICTSTPPGTATVLPQSQMHKSPFQVSQKSTSDQRAAVHRFTGWRPRSLHRSPSTFLGPETQHQPPYFLSACCRHPRQSKAAADCRLLSGRQPLAVAAILRACLRGKVQRDFRNGEMTRFLQPWRLVCLLWIS